MRRCSQETGQPHSRRIALARIGGAAMVPFLTWPKHVSAGTPLENAFDALVRSLGFRADLPGLALLVQQQGQPAFMRCVGSAILKDRVPVTPQTMFELASVSKTMTSTATLMLHDRGKLSVDDDIRKWIPEIPEYDKNRPIRIRNLLLHTSGLESYMALGDVSAKNKDYCLNSDYVGEFARQKVPLKFPTGRQYEYNNTNYMLLAVVIERVSKQSFGSFLRKEIFDPHGMKTAFVNEGPGSIPVVPGRVDAIGYGRVEGQWQELWGTPPARQETLLTVGDGAIWCSLEDMAAWDMALRSGKLLKPQTVQRALSPAKTRDGQTTPYGFGWDLIFGQRGRLIGFAHGGSWAGFGAFYHHDIPSNRTYVWLCNGLEFDGDELRERLTQLIDKHGLK